MHSRKIWKLSFKSIKIFAILFTTVWPMFLEGRKKLYAKFTEKWLVES